MIYKKKRKASVNAFLFHPVNDVNPVKIPLFPCRNIRRPRYALDHACGHRTRGAVCFKHDIQILDRADNVAVHHFLDDARNIC